MPPPQNLWVIDTRLTHFCHEKQRIYWPFLPWSFLYQHIPSVFFPPQADLSAARQTRIFTTETRRHRGKKRRRGVIKSEISKSHIDNACHKSGNLRFDNTVFNGEGEEFLITEPLDFCAHFTSPLSWSLFLLQISIVAWIPSAHRASGFTQPLLRASVSPWCLP